MRGYWNYSSEILRFLPCGGDDGSEIWRGWIHLLSTPACQISSPSVQEWGVGPRKSEDFSEYKHPIKFVFFWLAAKGRSNVDLREQFSLRPGTSQVMSHFRSKTPSKSYGELPDVHAWNRTASPTSAPIVKVVKLHFILFFTYLALCFGVYNIARCNCSCWNENKSRTPWAAELHSTFLF